MTNKEKYWDLLTSDELIGQVIAVDKESGEPCLCDLIQCAKCTFRDEEGTCKDLRKRWLKAECTDWTKVALNAKVLVKVHGGEWLKRHFAKYGIDGKVYTYNDGTTSYTAPCKDYITGWRYAKLYEENN